MRAGRSGMNIGGLLAVQDKSKTEADGDERRHRHETGGDQREFGFDALHLDCLLLGKTASQPRGKTRNHRTVIPKSVS
jgi:hypothetical protein